MKKKLLPGTHGQAAILHSVMEFPHEVLRFWILEGNVWSARDLKKKKKSIEVDKNIT